jgi:vanillate O-demethylase ferredoxin subunit
MTARLIMKMTVADVSVDTETVSVFSFRHPRRAHLPPPLPGAHVDLRLPDGRIRQYSLCGDPADDTVYRVAVKREDNGRGASRWFHQHLVVGTILPVSTPRNNFALATGAARHVLIAGGIGVTPFLPMTLALARRGAPFVLHYCARSARAPLIAALRTSCGRGELRTYFGDDPRSARLDAEMIAAQLQPGTHVYCCGPQRLTEAVRAATAHWPDDQVHFEVFKPTLDENFNPEPFDVKIASTGEVIRVPADRSALEVLREHGVPLPSSCELGVCGSCECGYREGAIIHRDSVLKTAARQDRMMLCVSRARVGVTLDL